MTTSRLSFRNLVAQARQGRKRVEDEAFFREMLASVDEPTAPFGLLEVQGDGSEIKEARTGLEAILARRLREQARALGVSAASLCHVAWARVLGRISGREDVVFGTVLLGRMGGGEGVGRALGLFINTLPIRVRVGRESVERSVRRTHELLAELVRHEHASLALAQRCSGVASPTPLFSSLLNYRHSRREAEPSSDAMAWAGIEVLESGDRTDYPLGVIVDDLGNGFRLTAQAIRPIEPGRICDYMMTALEQLVEALERAPETEVRALEVLPEAERRQLLEEWNETQAEYPMAESRQERCVHELFEEQAEERPEAIALVHEEQILTYGDLNARANRLAHYLRGMGVEPDVRVAICLERSVEMVVALLAVLKAGGAYVPLDPSYPPERLAYMLEDSAVAVLLTHDAAPEAAVGHSPLLLTLNLESDAWQWADHSEGNPGRMGGPNVRSLAYLIYTSGSTGLPKGVMVEHQGLSNLAFAQIRAFAVGSDSRVLQFASISFDASIFELTMALSRGAVLVLPPRGLMPAGEVLIQTVERHDVSHATLPPAVLAALPEKADLASIRELVVAGEAVTAELAQSWSAGRRMTNAYGPTEATVWATGQECRGDGGRVPPIGRPIANTQVYILDENQQPVPIEVRGELYIGGVGVARGYLNRAELTAERFVPDPYGWEPGARLYQTGDLGRWLPQGAIEFLGRNDYQVKVRGYRIELGEIEARMAEHGYVRDAVVVARDEGEGSKRLVAYYTGQEIGAGELRAHLSATLPEYMIPAAYVYLESLPLTANGKLDRRALPEPDAERYVRQGYEPPANEIETRLARIWAELLKVERVGRQDNFFELGGHSLLAVQALSRLQQALGVEVALASFFTHPILADFARAVEGGSAQTELPPITVADRNGQLELSYAQQRLWFLDQFRRASQAYRVAGGLRLTGDLDRRALRRALDQIVARHEALRTTFSQIEGHPIQIIGPAEKGFQLQEHDLREVSDATRELGRLADREATEPFDLEIGPLIRGQLVRMGEEEHVLLMTMHHIVSDGWSLGILITELSELYRAYRSGEAAELPELPIQYADYAAWQQRWMSGELLGRQAEYWKRTLAGAPVLLEVPTDRTRPAVQDYAGGSVGIELYEGLTAELKALSRRQGTTLYMTLLAGWAALLGRLSGQDEVVIGTPVANRTRMEIEPLIGFFVNTLALRIDLSGGPRVEELLERVKERAVEGQENQDIPFEQVVELVQPERSLAHAPIFQVTFTWQNAPEGRLELPGLTLAPMEVPRVTSIFDLSLLLQEVGQGIAGGVRYATALYDGETMERYLGYWRRLLEGMAGEEGQEIDRLALLGEAERRQLLEEWNETEAEYPREKCVHELFEEQVERSPEAVAVVYEDEQVSYAELNARANRLAHHLRGMGVGPDVRVAICLERSVEMVVALLAVLKAGGAYVPLDPAYPAERLNYMLEDSAAAILLTHAAASEVPVAYSPGLLIINLDGDEWQWAGQSERNPERAVTGVGGSSLAYVIYTSGSTGLPKGVMNEHQGLVNLVNWHCNAFQLTPGDRSSCVAGFGFDAAVWEIWPTLCIGANLLLPASTTARDPERLLAWWRVEPLDVSFLPTPIAELAFAGGIGNGSLRTLLIGGDRLQRPASPAMRASLVNNYGPTETTVVATSGCLAPIDNLLHIGRPISNAQIYILDANQLPVPIRVTGEIYIGGAGVARGYLNRRGLTAERFLPDPYRMQPGGRLYRTGDLARWLPEGEIEFLGRNDFQVKVSGFRIELGEIEAVLNEHRLVRKSVVVARENENSGKRLFGYVVGEKEATSAELKRYLKERLPKYMVPAEIMIVEDIPLLPSGKIDRNALPSLDIVRPELHVAYIAPRTELERMIAGVWEVLLQVQHVGIHDNFFDLGANSLMMVQAATKLQDLIQRELPVLKMFQYPTISALAAHLDQERTDETSIQQKGDFEGGQEDRVVARGQDEWGGMVTQVDCMADDYNSNSTAFIKRPSDIAVIGMSGRFPQAPTIDIFWRNLCDAREAIISLSDSQLLAAGVDPDLLADPGYVKAAASLDGIDLFDASFFGFNPREAELLDPQHRLFLQAAWHALESAGYVPDRFPGLIGLFAGAGANSYLLTALHSNPELVAAVGSFQAHISNDKDFLPTRVSYKLNLRGPSVAVQTGCSTSLVAVHLACQSLLHHECDIALAGGVTIAVLQGVGYLYQEGGIASSDGHCRAFDAQASGAVGGSGLGVVVLKRLAEARADGDNILAVIKGSAINNDGANKVGYTAPSIDGQARVIADAQAVAGVDPATITYIEAHGTGTALGDPIEIAALTQAFRAATDQRGFCAIGSVKTNVGHLDTAAGVTGLIKTVLALKHRQIPASLHFERSNPQIDFASSPFYVNTELRQWESNGAPRRAGVSSFGIGGTNVHLILEEPPEVEHSESVESPQLLVLSARSDRALTTMAAQLARHLRQNPELNLADLAFTLQEGRKAFAHRLSLVCSNLAEAVSLLEERGGRRTYRAVAGERARPIVYMFPGQGVQYVGMGRELYEQEPAYRSVIDHCAELVMEVLGIDLRRVLYPGPAEEAQASELVDQTSVTQVSLFAVELGLARMWQNKGVQPVAMIGHSLGEYVAGCLAGVISEEQAIKLVAKRGALMQRARPGAMLAVSLSEGELGEALWKAGSRLEVAAVNGPEQCVVSGEEEAIAEFGRRLSEARIASKRLKTSHAFHSRFMEEVVGEFEKEVEKMELRRPAIRYISNVSGKWITVEEAQEASYWGRQMRAPVRYWEGLKQIDCEIEEPVLLEVGPGDSLSQLARRLNGEKRQGVVATLRGESEGATRALMEAVGRMWAHGVEIEWEKWRKGKRRRVELPGYAFEEKRYWVKGVGEGALFEGVKRKEGVGGWFYVPVWREMAAVIDREDLKQSQRWLIMEDEEGVGERIVAELERQGCVVTRVKKAKWYERRGEREYWIRVGEAGDYNAVLKELEARGALPEKIVHLFSLDCGKNENTRGWEERIKRAEEVGFYSLVYMAQGLGQRKGAQEVEVVVVSNGVADVTGEEDVRAEKAVVLGPVGVMRQEYPLVNSRYIDVIIPPPGSRQEERLIKQLISDLRTKSADRMIAYRGNHRWKQTYEAVQLARAPVGAELRPEGVYLITGGLGKIGMVLAEYLAHSVKARLVLTGREGLPERSEWDRLMSQVEAGEELRQKISKIKELEKAGAKVEVIRADVSEETEMREVVRRTQQMFGSINGVIHAAGITDPFRLIQDITPANSNPLFRPKIYGLFVLEKVFQDMDLDFCLLFSSLSSVLGGLGFAAYSGSNIFMDAFVSRKNRTSPVPWISINWDGWQLRQEDYQHRPGFGSSQAELAIKSEEGIEAFQRIIAAKMAGQVVVSTADLQSRIRQWVDLEALQNKQVQSRSAAISEHARPELQTDYIAPRNDLERSIAAIWQNLLGLKQVGVQDNFFEIGGHSLLAIQYLSRLRQIFQVEIPMHSLFEMPTIAAHGEIIEEMLIKEIEALTEEEVVALQREDHVHD
jgi:amino acid adenylation domain-containing protein